MTTLKDFNNKELLFLKKIIEIEKRGSILADALIGEADFRIIEPHDVDRFSFVWDLNETVTEVKSSNNTIIVPIERGRNDLQILKHVYNILTTMADIVTSKKAPFITKLNKFINKGIKAPSDLKYIGEKFFRELKDCYQVVDSAWDVINGEFVCNHGLISYNRIYRNEFAYGAEELYELMRRDKC